MDQRSNGQLKFSQSHDTGIVPHAFALAVRAGRLGISQRHPTAKTSRGRRQCVELGEAVGAEFLLRRAGGSAYRADAGITEIDDIAEPSAQFLDPGWDFVVEVVAAEFHGVVKA